MDMSSMFGGGLTDLLGGITPEMIATSLVTACVAGANGSDVDPVYVIARVTDKEWAKHAPRGTAEEQAISRGFAYLADEMRCVTETVQLHHDAGISHQFITAALSNYILMVHIRQGYTVLLPDGTPMSGFTPQGERISGAELAKRAGQ